VTGLRARSASSSQKLGAAGLIIGAIPIADAAEPFRLPLGSAIYFAVLTFTLAQASVGFIITINVMLRTPRGDFKRYYVTPLGRSKKTRMRWTG